MRGFLFILSFIVSYLIREIWKLKRSTVQQIVVFKNNTDKNLKTIFFVVKLKNNFNVKT